MLHALIQTLIFGWSVPTDIGLGGAGARVKVGRAGRQVLKLMAFQHDNATSAPTITRANILTTNISYAIVA